MKCPEEKRETNDIETERGYILGIFQHEKVEKTLHFAFDFSASVILGHCYRTSEPGDNTFYYYLLHEMLEEPDRYY